MVKTAVVPLRATTAPEPIKSPLDRLLDTIQAAVEKSDYSGSLTITLTFDGNEVEMEYQQE